eukprot:3617259-Heterocapsa_arctica.AAC.1
MLVGHTVPTCRARFLRSFRLRARIGRTRQRIRVIDRSTPDSFSRWLLWGLRTPKDSLHRHAPDAVRQGQAFLPVTRGRLR